MSTLKKLDQISHCLERPQMYIGSNVEKTDEQYVFDIEANKFIKQNISYVPAIQTLFAEVINNSYDEFVRNRYDDSKKKKLNSIFIEISQKNASFTVADNGGIPVKFNTVYNEWPIESMFGSLHASTNFDDNRGNVSGLNGVGASLVNIFSKKYTVETADGEQLCSVEWTNNSRNKTKAIVKKSNHKKTVTYAEIDLTPFKIEALSDGQIKMMINRCIELAASGFGGKDNLVVTVKLVDTNQVVVFQFKDFQQYVDLFVIDSATVTPFQHHSFAFSIGCATGAQTESVALLNGLRCDKGTHIDMLTIRIADHIVWHLKEKHGLEISRQKVRNRMSIYAWWSIPSPTFSTQTKEELITNPAEFGFDALALIPLHYFTAIEKSPLYDSIYHMIKGEIEYAANQEKKKLHKEIFKKSDLDIMSIKRLTDANAKDRSNTELFIVEGDSAGGAFRKARDVQQQGLFILRGKFINTMHKSHKELMSKEIISQFVQATKCTLDGNIENSRFQYYNIMTDADADGDGIAAMLLLFIKNFFPDLIEQGRVRRVLSPIYTAKKGKDARYYYSHSEYEKDVDWLVANKYEILHIKGLGSLEESDYKELVRNPVYQVYTADSYDWDLLFSWFGGNDSLHFRKMMIDDSNYMLQSDPAYVQNWWLNQ